MEDEIAAAYGKTMIVAGIDVGGSAKGFHAVALCGYKFCEKFTSCEAEKVVDWCRRIGVRAVGIDAPCRWSSTGRARKAERDLAAVGIHAFATPSKAKAESSDFYRWMINGAELYRRIIPYYPLFSKISKATRSVSFETFPQAIACALAKEVVSAKQKRVVRRALLQELIIDITQLSNIDFVDAALCAVAAQYLVAGNFKKYGNAAEGFIIVPDLVR